MKKIITLLCCLFCIVLLVEAQPQLVKKFETAENFIIHHSLLWFTSYDTLFKTTGAAPIVLKTGLNNPANLTSTNSYVYFTTDNPSGGLDLWAVFSSTDQVARIGNFPFIEGTSMTNVNGTLFFAADDGVHGKELWKSTFGATPVLVKDINPGVGSSMNFASIPKKFLEFLGGLVFVANDGVSGEELWTSNGTSLGTKILKDIVPGSIGSNPGELTNIEGLIYFEAFPSGGTVELWTSTGLPQGTVKVKSFSSPLPALRDFSYYKGEEYFLFQKDIGVFELWKTNGTSTGTTLVKSLPNDNYDNLQSVNNYNNLIFTSDRDPWNIWKSDGTATGTTIFKSLDYGGSSIELASTFNRLFFPSNGIPSEQHFRELWETDLTNEGTFMLKDAYSGIDSSYAFVANLISNGDAIYFTTNKRVGDKFGPMKLWKYTVPLLGVNSLTLINSITDKDIRIIKNGDTLTKSESININVRANTFGQIGSIVFYIDGVKRRTEGTLPYSLFGDNNGDYMPNTLTPGRHTIQARAYNSGNGTGSEGKSLTINFFVSDQDGALNKPPVANAGADKGLILPANSITLNGIGSDPDGSIAAYSWTKVSGPSATIAGANTAQLILSNLLEGIYTFRLTVTDNKGATAFDDVLVTVKSTSTGPLVASFTLINTDIQQAIKDISNGEVIDLSQYQTRNFNIKVNTTPSVIGKVVIVYDGSTRTENTAPYSVFGDAGAFYAGKLTLGNHTLKATPYDQAGKAYTAFQISFTVVAGSGTTNNPPSANAGSDKTLTLPTNSITLNGNGTDTDGNIITYLWSQVSGTFANFTGENTANLFVYNLTEGLYTFRLTVTDNKNATGADDINVIVKKASTGQSVISFSLMDSDKDIAIRDIQDGDQINLAEFSSGLNIRINTSPATVGSIYLTYDGASRFENGAPYSLFGDNNGDYKAGNLAVGIHNLSALPFTQLNGQGSAGTGKTISFNVINSSARIAGAGFESNSIEVFPNPITDNAIVVNLNEEFGNKIKLIVLDARGQILLEKQYNDILKDIVMPLENLTDLSGVYYLKVEGENKTEIVRLVKN